jgi:hypothetical protein
MRIENIEPVSEKGENMCFVQITFHFEFWEKIESILDRHEIEHFVRYPTVQGKDSEGKHYGSQVFPGSVSVVQAQVEEDKIEDLFKTLKDFREERRAHQHLEAIALEIERRL